MDAGTDARFELRPIGVLRTPWATRSDCPRNIRLATGSAEAEIFPPYRPGLADLEGLSHVILLYWLHDAERDVLVVTPPGTDRPRGVFSTRAPVRPNPIGIAAVALHAVTPSGLRVGPLDCVSGTPLLDVKPYLPSVDAIADAVTGWHGRRG